MSIGNLGLLGIQTNRPAAVDIGFNVATQIGTTLALALAGKRRKAIPSWSFAVDEPAYPYQNVVAGQLPVSDVTDHVATTWVDLPLHGVISPPGRWVGGQNDRFEIELELHAADSTQSIEPTIAALKALTKPIDPLLRPPRVQFESGSYSFYGAVLTVDVKTRQPRDDGSMRMAVVSVTMMAVGDAAKPLLPTDPGKPPARSRWHVVRRGEDFEQIGKREYGDARFGVPLRQDHLDAFPRAGDRVFLSDRVVYQRRAVAPDSFFLSADPSVLGPYLDLLEARGGVVAVKG